MRRHINWLILIILLSVISLWVALPDSKISNIPDYCYENPEDIPREGIFIDTDNNCAADINWPIKQSLGLDLVGGLRVLLQAELPPESITSEAMRETANNVNRRVNGLGLTEATVQVQGSNRILVELPGVRDPQQAVETIQQTALLEFVDFKGLRGQLDQLDGKKILTTEQLRLQKLREAASNTAPNPESTTEATLQAEATVEATPESTPESTQTPAASGTPPPAVETGMLNPLNGLPFETAMTGAGLQAAQALYGATDQTGVPTWYIRFELNADGAAKFGPFTASRVNEPMAIVLDGVVLSAPIINDPLTTGGIISGRFTEQEAKQLALQLRSGALPIPLRVESAEEVGATLGQESVRLSIRAGVIGVIIVLSFMLIYYRVPGIAADLALMVFVLLNMASFKLIPVTVTLPAITGFLISIGMAVDGNILIFERMKEELRAGSPLDEALDAGFHRAWNSIRDSNLSTIIICGILLLFGQTPGASIVSGFAITLALGLILNLFTAIIVTRTFLHILAGILRTTLVERRWLLGV